MRGKIIQNNNNFVLNRTFAELLSWPEINGKMDQQNMGKDELILWFQNDNLKQLRDGLMTIIQNLVIFL